MTTQSPDTYHIELCRGARDGHCPYALPVPGNLAETIAEAVETSGWPTFLATACAPRAPRHHEQFRIAVAACANGCSRPHIADIGVVFAQKPAPPVACSGCGACAAACPDHAITLDVDDLPTIDPEACLLCGRCVSACPEEVMDTAESGCRFLLGGKLGRRPRLAAELPGLLDPHILPERISGWLSVFMAGYEPGCRFADVVERIGLYGHLPCGADARTDNSRAGGDTP